MIDFLKLKVGEVIRYSGTIFTARDQAHLRLHNILENNEKLPIDLNDGIIYYAGPTPTKPNCIIGSIGPTTSTRMDKFILDMPKLGVRAMIGKGPRNQNVVDACKKYGLVYFVVTGGAGALLSKRVVKAEEVAFADLDCESIKKLEVKDFPLIVAIDSNGNDIFKKEDNK